MASALHPVLWIALAFAVPTAAGRRMKNVVLPRTTDEWLNLEVMNFHTLPAWRRHPDAVTWMRSIAEETLGGITVH